MKKHALKISVLVALILIALAAQLGRKQRVHRNHSQVVIPKTMATPSVEKVQKLSPPIAQAIKIPKPVLDLSSSEKTELAKQLELFQELDVKVLMNPNEKERYLALLQKQDLHKLIRRSILTASKENKKLQDTGLELLVSAIESNIDVSSVVKDIMSDGEIESTTLAQDRRQIQAELKAELLYSWTSHNPEQTSAVTSALPGPVSQNIWHNVQREQANNVEESIVAK